MSDQSVYGSKYYVQFDWKIKDKTCQLCLWGAEEKPLFSRKYKVKGYLKKFDCKCKQNFVTADVCRYKEILT
jgi:hypothetical protein